MTLKIRQGAANATKYVKPTKAIIVRCSSIVNVIYVVIHINKIQNRKHGYS